MTLTERSRRRVRDALDRLDGEFGVERVVERRWEVPPADYDRTVERFEAGTLGGAGAWVRNDDGEVLLVRETDRDGWSEPSGKHEPGETLVETARREVREETGVRIAVTGVELAQVAPHVDRTDPDRPPVYRLVVVFAAERVDGVARSREGEIEAVDWFAEHPEELLYDALADLPMPGDE